MNPHLVVKTLIAITLLVSTFTAASTISGRVVRVADGDTITVLDQERQQHKVRLDGIDAPEKAQPFGQRSKDSLSQLVAGQVVEVDTHKRDRYGRVVGKVIHQGRDVNLEQVRRGMAWHYKAYEGEQTSEERLGYSRAEDEARSAGVGLWADKFPTPPWDWRKLAR